MPARPSPAFARPLALRRLAGGLLLAALIAIPNAGRAAQLAPGGPPEPTPREQARVMHTPLVITRANSVVRLTGPLSFPGTAFYVAAPNVTLDLAGHTVYYGTNDRDGCHGVHLYYDWADRGSVTAQVIAAGDPIRLEIKNGCLIHAGRGANCDAVFGQRGGDARFEDVHLEASGEDSASIFLRYEGCRIQRSLLISHADRSADRHAGPANVRVPEGAVIARGNLLVGGNSGFNVGSRSRIEGNLILHDSHVTNGYGVWLYRKDDALVAGNLILPRNGRGVLLNAGRRNTVRDNVILARERPNAEYGYELNAGCVRMRYEAEDNRIENNALLAIGGPPWTGASGLYLSNTGGGRNVLRGNDCLAVLVDGPEHDHHYAKAITFEVSQPDPARPSVDEIRGNRWLSNHWIVSLSGPDGGCQQGPVVGNQLSWLEPAEAARIFLEACRQKLSTFALKRHAATQTVLKPLLDDLERELAGVPPDLPRQTFYCGYYDWPERLTLLDCQGDAGLQRDDVLVKGNWPSPIDLAIGRTLRLACRRGDGSPLARLELVCTSDCNDRFACQSDAEGFVEVPLVRYGFDKPPGSEASLERRERRVLTVVAPGFRSLAIEVAAPPEALVFEPR